MWINQEGEIEYVADDQFEEEEEDIEDMGGLALNHSHADDDNGRAKFYTLTNIVESGCLCSRYSIFYLYNPTVHTICEGLVINEL